MPDIKVLDEVVLAWRALPQPEPFVVEGGDCGACALAGVLGVGVEVVYDRLCAGRREALSRLELESAADEARRQGLLDRVVADVPFWPSRKSYLAFGHPGHLSFPEWWAYVRMALDGGCYGLCSVDFDRRGARHDIPPETDHVVVLCGAREVCVPHPTMAGASRIDRQVLVSCSARSTPDEEWVEVRDFLSTRGGYNVLLVRPTRRP